MILTDGGPEGTVISRDTVKTLDGKNIEQLHPIDVNYLYLIINPRITMRHHGSIRSFLVVATSVSEAKNFIVEAADKGDAVSSKARIAGYPAWPEYSLEGNFWANDIKQFADDLYRCEVIKIGFAENTLSKGILMIDNID